MRLIYHGGKRDPFSTRFIATMVCDKDKQNALRTRREDMDDQSLGALKEDSDEEEDEGSGPEFISYKIEPVPGSQNSEENWVLRIRWKTVHACENNVDKDSSRSGHWGFFTWFIIMLVLTLWSTTCISLLIVCQQIIPFGGRLSHLWIMAQLQPTWRKRLGSPAAWRHNPRHPVSAQRLGAGHRGYCPGDAYAWRIQPDLTTL